MAKNIDTDICKNTSKNLSSKCSQKRRDHAKLSATDAFKTALKRAIRKTTEATGDLIGNKIANNSETVTNEHDEEIPKERYISQKKRQKIIDNIDINIIVRHTAC